MSLHLVETATRSEAAPLLLEGRPIPLQRLWQFAISEAPVILSEAALDRVAAGRAALLAAIEAGVPVYGATTGVGARKGHHLMGPEISAFNAQLVQAHAFSTGLSLPPPAIRLALALRLNTALSGQAGCSPDLLLALAAMLNSGLLPEVGRDGSVGCGDIGTMGRIGAALAGEGMIRMPDGRRLPADVALAAAGLTPFQAVVKDSLALISNNATAIGQAVLHLVAMSRSLQALLAATAAAAAALSADPAPWRSAAAAGHGRVQQMGAFLAEEAAIWSRRPTGLVHDPLSLRMLAEIWGPILDRLEEVEQRLVTLSAFTDDNPLVLDGKVQTSGGSIPLGLTLALESLRVAAAHGARSAMMLVTLLADGVRPGLPVNLVPDEQPATGFGPVVKHAGSQLAAIMAEVAPVSTLPLVMAGRMEDESSFLPLALDRAERQAKATGNLAAVLAILSAQAADLLGSPQPGLPAQVHAAVRTILPPFDADRPLYLAIEALAASLPQLSPSWLTGRLPFPPQPLP